MIVTRFILQLHTPIFSRGLMPLKAVNEINYLHAKKFCMPLSSDNFCSQKTHLKFCSGIPLECQTVWIQIRPNFLLGLIWVQTIHKNHQQKTHADKD